MNTVVIKQYYDHIIIMSGYDQTHVLFKLASKAWKHYVSTLYIPV